MVSHKISDVWVFLKEITLCSYKGKQKHVSTHKLIKTKLIDIMLDLGECSTFIQKHLGIEVFFLFKHWALLRCPDILLKSHSRDVHYIESSLLMNIYLCFFPRWGRLLLSTMTTFQAMTRGARWFITSSLTLILGPIPASRGGEYPNLKPRAHKVLMSQWLAFN